jgi:hypothetical protein
MYKILSVGRATVFVMPCYKCIYNFKFKIELGYLIIYTYICNIFIQSFVCNYSHTHFMSFRKEKTLASSFWEIMIYRKSIVIISCF